MSVANSFRCIWALFCFGIGGAFGQATSPSQATGTQASPPISSSPTSASLASVQTFQQGQQALNQSLQALMTQNPTSQQLQAWQQQNATAIASQRQLAQSLVAYAAVQPLPMVTDVYIPAGASQTMDDFLVAQAELSNAQAQIHNAQVQGLSGVSMQTLEGAAQLKTEQQNESASFQQQNGAALQAQQQRVCALADEVASKTQPMPPPLSIPDGTSTQMAAFLTARDQLMRDEITFFNQHTGDMPAIRQAALQNWTQANAARYAQINQLAQNLTTTR